MNVDLLLYGVLCDNLDIIFLLKRRCKLIAIDGKCLVS